MKQVKFQALEVRFDGKNAHIEGNIEPSQDQSSFTNDEIKEMLAAILQNLTSIGDGYGNPIPRNINIDGNSITGNQ